MRSMLIPAVAAAALLATPALAQSQQQTGQAGKSATTGQQGMQAQAMTQDKLRSSLEQAGFKQVTVLDAAYLVQAQSPNGEQVMMFINPPSTGGASASAGGASGSMTGTGSAGAGAGSGSGQQQPGQGSSTNQ
jgi:hypothetical protein